MECRSTSSVIVLLLLLSPLVAAQGTFDPSHFNRDAAPLLTRHADSSVKHLFRRRNNYTNHPPETLQYLIDFNQNVPFYYWMGLLCLITIVTVANWSLKLQGFLRRRKAGHRTDTKRLPRVKSVEPEIQHRISLRYFWYWVSAFWRRYSIKHSGIAEAVYLGDLAQLGLIAVYLLLNFLLMFLGTEGDIDWYAHHAAKLTYANLPLVIGLAGKNNVLSRLTGFAYESLNVLHRWSARFIIVSSTVHIGGRIYVNQPSVAPNRSGGAYIAWGWAAYALFVLMIIAASRKIRNWAYEPFLVLHVFCWLLIVPSLIIHRPQDQGWIWAGFALHLLDRIARGLRVLTYTVLKTTEEREGTATATVRRLTEDTILVSVRTRQFWIAAQHVYLNAPRPFTSLRSLSLGGHPFTISSVPHSLQDTSNARPREATQEMIIRVREGLTRYLYNVAVSGGKDDETAVEGSTRVRGEHREVPLRAWTEGPYGHESYLGEDYDTTCFVSGGSGVSYALAHSLELVRRKRAMVQGSKSRSISVALQRLTFVWVIKRAEQASWIDHHLQEMCMEAPPGFFNLKIYVTGKRNDNDPPILPGFVTRDLRDSLEEKQAQAIASEDQASEKSDLVRKVVHGASVELFSGRPDFDKIVEDEVEATKYEGWLAFGTCGPTPLTNALADAVGKAVKPMQVLRGEVRRNIKLETETFGW